MAFGVDGAHAEGVLAFAQLDIIQWAGAGDEGAAVKLARKGHRLADAGRTFERKGRAVDRIRVRREAGDGRVRRIDHRQVGQQVAAHGGDLAGEVDGAHGDEQLPPLRVDHGERRAPCAAAEGRVDKGLVVHPDLHRGQPYVVAGRTVEAQDAAARLPGVGAAQRGGGDVHIGRLGIEEEGDLMGRSLHGAVPITGADGQRVRADAGHGDGDGALRAGDQFRLAEGERLHHDAVERQLHVLQTHAGLGGDGDVEAAGRGHIAQVARGDDHRLRRARRTQPRPGAAQGGRRVVGAGAGAEKITCSHGGDRLLARLPQRVAVRQLAQDGAVGEDRLHGRVLGEEALRRLEGVAVASKGLFDQVAILRAACVEEFIAREIGCAVEVACAGGRCAHHQARGQGVDHPAPDAGRDGAIVEQVGSAQVDLILAFQTRGDLNAPGAGSRAWLHQRGGPPDAPRCV